MKASSMENPMKLKSLNHISLVCRSLDDSIHFYRNVLGFFPIRRPGSFDFDGAWLFGFGIGIHLLQSEDPENMPQISHINPKDSHFSFQCESMGIVEKKLKEMKVEYVKGRVEEGGIYVDQIFFHDPDGTMIEICNCEVLPVIPLVAAGEAAIQTCSRISCINKAQQQKQKQKQQQQLLQVQQVVQVKQQQPPAALPSIHLQQEDYLPCA